MSSPEPQSTDLIEDLTYRCLEAIAGGENQAIDDLLVAQPEAVRADVRRRLATLQRVGLAGDPGGGATPDRFGPFQLLARIGAGSMGVVYRATREGTPGELALKLLQPGLLPLHGARLRFRREIAALRELAHPAICPILDDGEIDGVPYLAMPFVAGESLHDWFARVGAQRGESRGRLLVVVEQIAAALHHAHERGFVHRDVKPANVLVRPDGDAVLLDFGLARLDTGSEPGSRLTVSGALLGTPAYMAPEQVAGTALDRRCDIYALGAVLYEGLTGVLPHNAPTRASLFRRILTGDIAPPSRRIADLPRDLDVVCLTALERDPAKRYATAQALADDLELVRAGQRPLARLPGPWRRTCRWVARHPLPSVLLVVLSSALLGILLLAGRLGRERRDADARASEANARNLATRARALVAADPHVALHLALQAYDQGASREAAAAVQAALAAERTAVELEGHRGRIIALQFSGDGQQLLSAEAEGGIASIWDLRTQKSRELAHGAPLRAASLAPAGKIVVSAGEDDGRVCAFDRSTGARLWSKLAHAAGKPITTLCWSPLGGRLLTASADGTAKIWDPAGELLAELPVHAAAVTAGVWLDERTVVTGTGQLDVEARLEEDHATTVCAWRLEPGAGSTPRAINLDEFVGCKRSVLKLIAHPTDRELLLVISNETVARLWRLRAAPELRIHELLGAPTSHVVAGGFLGRDGARVFTAAFGGRVAVWDLEGMPAAEEVRSRQMPLRTAIPIPGPGGILHAGNSGVVRAANDSGVLVRTFGNKDVRGDSLAVAPDGGTVAATTWDGRILLWRPFDPIHPVVPVGQSVDGVCWLHDGTIVIGGTEGVSSGEVSGRVQTWNPETGTLLDPGSRAHGVFGIWPAPDGKHLVVARGSIMKFSLEVLRKEGTGWVADGVPRIAAANEQGCYSGCFVAGGTIFVACMAEGRVRLWDLRTREIACLPEQDPAGRGPYREWMAVTATPDGRTIWAGGTPGVLHRFDRQANGSYRESSEDLHTQIRVLEWLPDDSLLVGGAAGYLVRFIGAARVPFRGHLDTVRALTWTRLDDEDLIVSGDVGGLLRLWRLDGTFLRELPGHARAANNSIIRVCFSPDGTRILSGSADGTARIWWTREEDLLRVARKELRPLTEAQLVRFGIEQKPR